MALMMEKLPAHSFFNTDFFNVLQVLGILVRAVNENLDNAEGEPSAHLRPKMLELFGRLTSKVSHENTAAVVITLLQCLECSHEWSRDFGTVDDIVHQFE